MNKYQGAFERIERVVVFNKNYNDYRNDLKVVQELVDKETPVKPYNQHLIDFGLGNCGSCEICNCLVNYQMEYCPSCGKKLDWSDE